MLVVPLTGLLLLLVAGAIFVFIRKRPLYVHHDPTIIVIATTTLPVSS